MELFNTMVLSEKPKQRNLISLTPLIDVVFILLVFFMLTSSFVEWKFIDLGIGEANALPL
ncbi:MAG: biopolymer transport protein ExbD, partial [Oleispira sp.]